MQSRSEDLDQCRQQGEKADDAADHVARPLVWRSAGRRCSRSPISPLAAINPPTISAMVSEPSEKDSLLGMGQCVSLFASPVE
jgi:hypothetical protein